MNSMEGRARGSLGGEFHFVTDGIHRWCDLVVEHLPLGRVLVICSDAAHSRQSVRPVVERLATIFCRRWCLDPYSLIWIERHDLTDGALDYPVYCRLSFNVAPTVSGWCFIHPQRHPLSASDLMAMRLAARNPQQAVQPDIEDNCISAGAA